MLVQIAGLPEDKQEELDADILELLRGITLAQFDESFSCLELWQEFKLKIAVRLDVRNEFGPLYFHTSDTTSL